MAPSGGARPDELAGKYVAGVDRLVVACAEHVTDRDARACSRGELERETRRAVVARGGVLCDPDMTEHAPYDSPHQARGQ